MKLKYLWIFLIVFSYCLNAGTNLIIRVTATGRASTNISPASKARAFAFRAAQVEGYKKLAEAVGGNKDVATFLKGARVIAKRYISDHEVEVVMEMPFKQPVAPMDQIKKSDSYLLEISDLKKEIKAFENQISTINSKLENLKKTVEALEEKIRNQNDRDEDVRGKQKIKRTGE